MLLVIASSIFCIFKLQIASLIPVNPFPLQSFTMRFTTLAALLPALALAQEQVPLADRVQGWFNKAKAYVPTAVPADPIVKMAEKVSERRVTPVTMQNWESILTPAARAQDWYIFVTGGQKTCFGRCEHAEKAFNVRQLRSFSAFRKICPVSNHCN